ncbi:hypothetical protein ACTXT7_016100 [Hymenolepis weldensis]
MKAGKCCQVKGHEINSHWRTPCQRNGQQRWISPDNIGSGRIGVSPGSQQQLVGRLRPNKSSAIGQYILDVSDIDES